MDISDLRLPEDVELVTSTEASVWATDRMRPWSDPTVDLWTFMPSGFDTYIRILHPMGDPGGGRSVRWADLAPAEAKPIGPAKSLRDIFGDSMSDQGWLQEHAPLDGSLPDETCEALVDILRGFTNTPKVCWMAVWNGWGGWRARASESEETVAHETRPRVERHVVGVQRPLGRSYLLFRAAIEKTSTFHGQTPQLWWPDDRRWFVSTEIDGFSTYVGAGSDLAAALLSSSEIETIEVPLDVRLDPEGW